MEIRVLIVGRATKLLEAAMTAHNVAFDVAALPAAAVRQMEAEPPDVLCLVEPTPNARTKLLIEGIRARPLGQLTPIVLLSPPVESLKEFVDLQLEQNTPGEHVIAAIFELLGLQQPSPPEVDEDVPYYIEEIVEEPSPRFTASKSIEALDADVVRRKLRAVRHEDYFVILEVGRGSESGAIREAFYRLSRLFDLRSAPFDLATRFEPEILEIADAVEDAWAVLGDRDLRRKYLAETSRT